MRLRAAAVLMLILCFPQMSHAEFGAPPAGLRIKQEFVQKTQDFRAYTSVIVRKVDLSRLTIKEWDSFEDDYVELDIPKKDTRLLREAISDVFVKQCETIFPAVTGQTAPPGPELLLELALYGETMFQERGLVGDLILRDTPFLVQSELNVDLTAYDSQTGQKVLFVSGIQPFALEEPDPPFAYEGDRAQLVQGMEQWAVWLTDMIYQAIKKDAPGQ